MAKKQIPLYDIAYARSGDKSDISDIGVIAKDKKAYEIIEKQVTPEMVKKHFGNWVKGEVKRYGVPGVLGFEYVLYGALGGGATQTLRADVTGKGLCTALLRLTVEVEE